MALSLLCGGLGVASATLEVVNQNGAAGTTTIYTKEEVDNALTAKGAATEVAANKTDIETLKTAVGNAGSGLTKEVLDQKADIATNRANINNLDGKLANLTTTVSGKADEAAVTTALGDKANTDLSNLTADGVNKIKNTMLADMDLKANKTYVDNALANKADTGTVTALDGRVGGVEGKVTTLETTVGDASHGLVKDVADLKAQGITLNSELGNKADKADLNNATNRITVNEGNISALQNKTVNLSANGKELTGMTTVEANALKVTGEIRNGAGVTTTLEAIDASMKQTATNKTDIAALQTTTNNQQTAIDGLNTKTTKIDYDAANDITSVNGMKVGQQVDMGGKDLTHVGTINGIDLGTKEGGNYISQDGSIWGNMKTVDTQVKTNADNIETNKNAITALDTKVGKIDDRTGGIKRNAEGNQTTIEDKVTVNHSGDVGGVKGLSAETINTTGNATIGGALNVTGESNLKNTTVDGTLTAKGEATFEKKVTMKDNLEVKGTLNTKDVTAETIYISKSEDKPDYKSEGSIIGEGGKPSVYNEKFDKINNITEKSVLNVNEKGTVNWATSTDATGNVTEGRSEVKADNIKNSVQKTEGGKTFGYEENITETGKVGTATDKDGNRNELTQTATGTENTVTSKDGNKSTTKQEAGSISSTVYDKDGNVKASSEMKEDGSISNNATGDMTNTVGGKLTTTVTGQATENFNSGLNTTVTGAENHTVTGKQTNTVGGGQENIISGGQTNTITGGQINNITGDQTTTVTDGNISNTAKNITNEATGTLTDQVGTNTRVTTSTSITDTVGTANRKIENDKITDTAGDSTVTTENGKGTTFAKTGSAAYSTEARAPTDTNIAGNHITTGRVDANELGVSDKDGANTADLSVKAGEGVKASAGNGTTTGSLDVTAEEVGSSVKDASGKGSTFKQRIDAIMMESKDVSIKADEKLTNEAKVITNKASEVINNEAININNTATGIITSKASEIKNQADKLISNKVGENTWENMENGKITTSIKDGAKQNLTQSDAAGTTQSTVDGAKSTVTIQNADGLIGAVTDGRNTSLQNQTASQIAAAVKDGAGNENASVANATTSANTITNGTKANTVISTADGTSFINSEANTAFEGGTYTDTTIKGNTITTGKVTMDYADVMKDLGVKGTTTTKTLKVTENATVGGTLDVTQRATFHDAVDIAKDLSVGGNATIAGDVKAKSYKVGDKTYIDANGINANNQKITNVADGSISEGSKDAVNGGQLYGVKRDLEHQVDKVGANAAAMANLRPMEFDPSSKWNIAAAIGNYGSETAAALGAFYRPNDNVMVNLSTAFGTGENMVGGGVSVRLGKGSNKLSREESNALKAQVNDLTARMDALLSVLNPNMSKDFPDVPENHWAYEAVSRLAGNDIVQGYPDGEFHGERTMTRYEMAEIIYNALSRGAEAERELVEEFKPELQAMAASEKATAERAEG